MTLNLTIEVIMSIISVLLTLIAAIIVFRQHMRNPDRALIIMSFAYVCLAFFFLFSGLGYLFLNPQVSMVKNIFLVFLCLTVTMTVSQMTIGKIITTTLVTISFFSAFAIAVFALPVEDNISQMSFANGDQSLRNEGINRFVLAFLFLYNIVALIYFSFLIYRHSPKLLQQNASMFFAGNIILAIFGGGSFISGVSTLYPGFVEISVSLGILISAIGLIRAPQILYVLPFEAIKLSIIKSDSGISFYNYYWSGTMDDTADQLFGAAILAITNFMKESVGEGGIEEIKMEGATLTIKKPVNQSIYYVVIATKPSYVLAKGLEQFARLFHEHYGELLSDRSNHEVQQFQKADQLIPQCFPYIPSNR